MNLAPDDTLHRIEPRGAPPGLRARALAAARAARRSGETVDLWTRIWANRPLRLAWVSCMVAVLLAHLALSLRPAPGAEPGPAVGGAYLVASTVPDDELRTLVELPDIALDTLPSFDSPTIDPHS